MDLSCPKACANDSLLVVPSCPAESCFPPDPETMGPASLPTAPGLCAPLDLLLGWAVLRGGPGVSSSPIICHVLASIPGSPRSDPQMQLPTRAGSFLLLQAPQAGLSFWAKSQKAGWAVGVLGASGAFGRGTKLSISRLERLSPGPKAADSAVMNRHCSPGDPGGRAP